MIDLEAIKSRVIDRDEHPLIDKRLLTVYEDDFDALVAEVERLREVNDGYLLEMGRQHALLRDQKRGENAERAAVVAWLREEIRNCALNSQIFWPTACADAIERGEHREEKE
jgi:hypothetical protein